MASSQQERGQVGQPVILAPGDWRHNFWVSLLSWFRQTKGLQDSVRAFVSKSNLGIARDCYLKFNSGLHKERCNYVHLPTYLHMYAYRTYKELTARCGAYLRQSQDLGGRV